MGIVRLVVAAAIVVVALLSAVAFGTLTVITVRGDSMLPTYRAGDRLLVRRRWAGRPVRRGDIVVCRPFVSSGKIADPLLVVKRVAALGGDRDPNGSQIVPDRHVYVTGDGPGSVDSRRFGPIPRERVLGRVLAVLLPADGPPGKRRHRTDRDDAISPPPAGPG
jgi:signal peptidase I